MKTLLSLWMLCCGSTLASSDAISARSRQLAKAVDAFHDGDAAQSMSFLLPLNQANPGDDDVAYWMARLHNLAGRHQAALALLDGRQGRNIPACRFRVLEARALAVNGQEVAALSLLEPCLDRPDPEQSLLLALGGLLFVKRGDEAKGVELMLRAGGVPWAVLDTPLRDGLPEAANVRALRVLEPVDGEIQVLIDGLTWQVDLKTGLARHKVQEASSSRSSMVVGIEEAQRTEMVPCGDGHVWSSPSEPLAGGASGVFRTIGGEVVRVAKSPGQGVDDSPSCAGEEVWFVRRVGGQSALISVRAGEDWAWSPPRGGLASVDARVGDDGRAELLLGWVVDGEIGVWITPAYPFEPVRLLSEEALAPRWRP